MSQHYFVSPSNAHRWGVCTPSAMLETHFPDQQSPSAAEGTFAHKCAEVELKHFLYNRPIYKAQRKKLMESEFWSQGLDDYVDEYVSEVIRRYLEVKARDVSATLMLEQKLNLDKLIPGGFGYGDGVRCSWQYLHKGSVAVHPSLGMESRENGKQGRLFPLLVQR